MRFLIFLLVTHLAAWSFQAKADDLDFLSFGGEGELYLPIPFENATTDGDRLRLRSAEFTVQSDFDDRSPALNGKLTLGAEDSTGDLIFNIREGFLSAELLKGLSLRAGKFYLPVGLLNQTRRSAWPFLSAPRALSLFFTENGVVDTGADLAYVTSHFAIRAGATNGFRYDSSVQNGGTKPKTPTHFVRPELSFNVGASVLTLAANYLGRVDDAGDVLHIAGLDGSISALEETPDSWDAQFEFYHRYQNPLSQNLPIVEDVGGYLFAEKGLGRSSLAGLRFDLYKIPSLTDTSGANRKNLTWALSPVFTYRGRDHLRFQAEYTYLKETRDGDSARVEQVFEIRLVTEFGEIPKFRTPGLKLDRSSL